MFVDEDKGDFIGKAALAKASKGRRSHGIKCMGGEPMINGAIEVDGKPAGVVTAGAMSPFLKHAIGIGLLDSDAHEPETKITVGCRDGSMQAAELVEMPFYDKAGEIQRGKAVYIPER